MVFLVSSVFSFHASVNITFKYFSFSDEKVHVSFFKKNHSHSFFFICTVYIKISATFVFSQQLFFFPVALSRWGHQLDPSLCQAPAFVPSWNLGPKVRNGRNLGDILGANESPGVFFGEWKKGGLKGLKS